MNFVQPVFLLGLLGMLIPLIIHLWRRRRAKTIRFGAIRFLLLSEKATRRRRRFWEYLLLLVRMSIIGVVALALAGPYRIESVPALALGSEQKALVIVLDDSMSMRREKIGRSLFEEAKANALSVLDQLSEFDYAGLVLVCAGEEIALTKDKAQIKARLAKAEPGFQRARLNSAINRAQEMLLRSEVKAKKVIVFSDLQKTSFSEELNLNPFSGEIYFYDLAGGGLEPNFSLSSAELTRISSSGEESIKVSVRVHNYSAQELEARLNLGLGGQILVRGTTRVPSWSSSDKFFLLNLGENFSAEGKLEIENKDSLSLDNLSYFHLRGGARVKALIVDGNWSKEPLNRDSYFLERALNPRLYALSRIDPEVIGESALSEVDLRNYQVIVFANLKLLDQAQVERVKNFVAEGNGLLITLGSNVEAEHYNKMLSELLPREIREVKVPYAGAEGKAEFQPLHLDSSFIGDPGRHPVLLPFSSIKEADPALASFYKYFLLFQELLPRSRVILQLSDGSPILVEKSYGKGMVMLFASTINQDWNDLCIYPFYLPIFYQATLYLGHSLFELGAKGISVGEQIELSLPPEKTSVLIKAPNQAEYRLSPEKEARAGKILIPKLSEPGIYYFWYLPGPEPRRESNADLVLAVNPDPEESDFRKISVKDLKKTFPAEALYVQSEDKDLSEKIKPEATHQVQKPYHHSFLLALMILLGLEMMILVRSGME